MIVLKLELLCYGAEFAIGIGSLIYKLYLLHVVFDCFLLIPAIHGPYHSWSFVGVLSIYFLKNC